MQFAPVRRLSDGALAAAELQVRGPAGSALSTADSLRHAARLMQQDHLIDRHKLAYAASSEVKSISEVLPLLVTVDLASADTADLDPDLERLAVSVQADEVLRNPQQTLAKVAAARRAGRMICVDGLGVSEYAITLLSLIEPDVIITGPELLTRTTDPDMARLAHALAAHVERSHAVVIAEGVDTMEMLMAAQTVGATFGTGKLYPPVDDPAVFSKETVVPLPSVPVWSTPSAETLTPYAIACSAHSPRRGTKRLLIEMSKALEAQASAAGAAVVVLGTFQHARHFTMLTAKRWKELADRTGLAGVYGVGLANMVDGNVQHAPLDPQDDLVNEWNVAVLGPHFCALLAARDLHEDNPDMERTFDFVQSYDRLTVTQAVHSILSRFTVS
ncbi:EAL domain-containing protein [Williamsia sp. CHRR-6]|uniref:EAL domain-containing protein n=1 Tax=Williamsia sp. CHRR-6 TaxID=2835871 RepID=UPI001BDA25E5|nr:EAL domain-containing protein [Williamsia sp. CHRR-6]MBT0567758.1 EAL domain-containing protein [Williamsia sp. CHRR-6]